MDIKKCSICGIEIDDKTKIVEGLYGNICHSCIEIVSEETGIAEAINEIDIKTKAYKIKEELDKYIIGQDMAKKRLAIQVSNHFKRISCKKNNIELPKTNMLMIGPSGSGKTYMIEILSKLLKLPFTTGDATTLTEFGYSGVDVDSLLISLINKADGDIKKAETGIVYIDEIDKIFATKSSDDTSKDVGGKGVQQALLKMIEGCDYTINKTGDVIDTRNILFICGGAFEGLVDIINERCNKPNAIGFNLNSTKNTPKTEDEKTKLIHKVRTDDLMKFGLIKEFVGRLQMIVTLDALTLEDLKDILLKPKNSLIKKYVSLMKLDGVKVKFDKKAIDFVAKESLKRGTGARGLASILSEGLVDIMYKLQMEEDIKEYVFTEKDFNIIN